MGETAPRQRAIVTVASKPVMPPHIKMRHDEGRGRWLILAPERVFDPDEIAVAILKLCDGQRSVGDIVGLVKALGEKPAVIVGHDWGAPAAWNWALLRPDMFRAVVGMSAPYTPPSKTDLLSALERAGVTTFYMQYFQQPGVAEAALERDPAASIRRITYSMSGDGPGRVVAGILPPGAGMLDLTVDPEQLPPWMDAQDLEYVANEFTRTGFRGGLNWYRSIRLTSELMAPWRDCVIAQPSLFIAGTQDDVLKFPGMQPRIAQLQQVLPGLRGTHLLEGAGHWVQRERADEVNRLLIAFLKSL